MIELLTSRSVREAESIQLLVFIEALRIFQVTVKGNQHEYNSMTFMIVTQGLLEAACLVPTAG